MRWPSCLWVLVLFVLLPCPRVSASAGAAPPDAGEAVRAELQRLDQEAQRLLIRLGRNAADGRRVPHRRSGR